MAAAAVEPPDGDAGGEAGELAFPVAEERGRAEHQGRPAGRRRSFESIAWHRLGIGGALCRADRHCTCGGLGNGRERSPVQMQGDQLDRLAQPHVVGQAGTQPEAGHRGQPGQSRLLVRPQRRLQPRRDAIAPPVRSRIRSTSSPSTGGAANSTRSPSSSSSPVSAAASASPASSLRVRVAHPRQQLRVHAHPLAAQADQGPLGLGQRRDLRLRQLLAAQAQLPAELQQALQRELRLRDARRRLGRARLRLHLAGEQPLRPQHLDAGAAQLAAAVGEQVDDLVVGQRQLRGRRLRQHPAQWLPRPRAAPQPEQQLRLDLVAEAAQHRVRRVPQRRRLHDQARLSHAADRQHPGERVLAPALDPQQHLDAAGFAGLQLGQPGRAVRAEQRRFARRERRVARPDRRRRAARQQVGRRVPERADQGVRRVETDAFQPGQRQRVRLRRQGTGQAAQQLLVGRVQRPDPPRRRPGRRDGGPQPSACDEVHPGVDGGRPRRDRRAGLLPRREQPGQRAFERDELGVDLRPRELRSAGQHELDRGLAGHVVAPQGQHAVPRGIRGKVGGPGVCAELHDGNARTHPRQFRPEGRERSFRAASAPRLRVLRTVTRVIRDVTRVIRSGTRVIRDATRVTGGVTRVIGGASRVIGGASRVIGGASAAGQAQQAFRRQ